jgi:hypothetical protein
MSEKIPYTQVARRITSDIDYIMEEAYLQGKEQGFCDGSIDVKKRVEEAYQKGFEAGQHEATTLEYQQGLNDAWEAARKICNEPEDGGLPAVAVVELFGRNGPILGCSAQNAINKIKAYEEQQKADGIKVGDEVEWEGEKIIVTQTFTPNLQKPQLHGIGSNGCVYYAILIEDVKKTGRHFPQVVELIKAMKEGAE